MPTYLQKLNQQVNILIQEGKYSEAIPLAESGLAILNDDANLDTYYANK